MPTSYERKEVLEDILYLSEHSWHKSGTRSLKQNSIQDFIYSAKYLVEKGYVHRHHLAAVGYSAGAILPAAAMNMHPSLFQAVILKVRILWHSKCIKLCPE